MSDPREQIDAIYTIAGEHTEALEAIQKSLTILTSIVRGIVAATPRTPTAPEIASDKMLDGRSGNPVIKAKPPRDWNGPSYVGRTLSECPPDLLELMAERHDYFASQDDAQEMRGEKTKEFWERRSASLCRGWAKRNREGVYVPAAPPAQPGFDDVAPLDADDIPF